LGWHNCVSEAAQAVTTDGRDQPRGNPISHSTNSGFNRRGEFWCGGEDGCPGIGVAGAWWEHAWPARTCPCLPAASLGATFVFRLEFGEAVGVAHEPATVRRSRPPSP